MYTETADEAAATDGGGGVGGGDDDDFSCVVRMHHNRTLIANNCPARHIGSIATRKNKRYSNIRMVREPE